MITSNKLLEDCLKLDKIAFDGKNYILLDDFTWVPMFLPKGSTLVLRFSDLEYLDVGTYIIEDFKMLDSDYLVTISLK